MGLSWAGAGAGDGEADDRWLADADALADWDVSGAAEAGALAHCDVPWDGDAAALAGEDALREASEEEDAEPDTPGGGTSAVDAAEDVSPAGGLARGWLGVGVLSPPANEFTAKPAMPAAIMPAMIHTSTIGRHKGRCGRFFLSGAGTRRVLELRHAAGTVEIELSKWCFIRPECVVPPGSRWPKAHACCRAFYGRVAGRAR